MLEDPAPILWETLQSQDGLNLGDVRFCPIRQTLRMQRISLDHLWKLITEGTPELSRTTAILLVFQAVGQHEKITDAYMGLIVRRVESCLYTPDQILDFTRDIEVDLKVAHNALKARGDPCKRRAFCLCQQLWGCHVHSHRPTLLPHLPDELHEGHRAGSL